MNLINIRFFSILFCILVAQTAGVQAARPNVLMIVVDDMNDWVGCMGGHPNASTPNIDRLAERGVLFTNAHCAAPVCNASRVATMTGLRPNSTGVYSNSVKWHQKLENVPSIPQHFKSNGYEVVGGGKVYHHMPGFNRESDWDFYFKQRFDGHFQQQLHRGEDVSSFRYPNGFPLNGIPAVKNLSRPPRNAREFDWGPLDRDVLETGDGEMIRWAAEFLKTEREKPFLLVAGIYRPHLPFYAPKKYFDRLTADAVVVPSVLENDVADLPELGKAFANQRREDLRLVKAEGKYREMIHAYLASISYADALVGELLKALDSSPNSNETIVVFWSDHGWHFGEKEHLHKMTLWERATRIPFIVSMPGAAQLSPNCEAAIGLVDLFPTLISLCNLPSISRLDGSDISPLLSNPHIKWEVPALTTHGFGNHAVRTNRWRYIRYADGGEELYDHLNDPNEWHNLAVKSGTVKIREQLSQWLPVANAKPLSNKRIP